MKRVCGACNNFIFYCFLPSQLLKYLDEDVAEGGGGSVGTSSIADGGGGKLSPSGRAAAAVLLLL